VSAATAERSAQDAVRDAVGGDSKYSEFRRAAALARSRIFRGDRVRGLSEAADDALRLELYALYKQATLGPPPAGRPRPGAFDFAGRAKRGAWEALGAMPPAEASRRYCDAVARIVPAEELRESEGGTRIAGTEEPASGSSAGFEHSNPRAPDEGGGSSGDAGGGSSGDAGCGARESPIFGDKDPALAGFCASTPLVLRVCGQELGALEIHSLFVAPADRGLRLTPALVQEMVLLGIDSGVQHAVHTHATRLPGVAPIATATYFSRPLARALRGGGGARQRAARRLHAAQRLSEFETLTDVLLRLEPPPRPAGLSSRPMREADAPAALAQLEGWIARGRFALAPSLSAETLWRQARPRGRFMFSHVLAKEDGVGLSGFFSYYALIDSATGLRACMLLFCASATLSAREMLAEALRTAEEVDEFDVFCALDVGGLAGCLPELGFRKCAGGAQRVHYYVYNFECRPPLSSDEVAIVLP
jgi:acyl-CoA-binding protein